MVRVVPELKKALIDSGRWVAYAAAYDRRMKEGTCRETAKDDAIDEVCPDLAGFKKRNKIRKIEDANSDGGDGVNDAQCNGYRMLEWVVENYENRNRVSVTKAPSRAAYAVLQACGRDDDTYRDVLKKYLDSKLKLDAAQGDTNTATLDGQKEYDILEGLKLEIG